VFHEKNIGDVRSTFLGPPMSAPSAVIFAAHPWNGIPYGLHHLARALARLGWQVLYIEPYFSPLHLVGGRRRGRMLAGGARKTEEPGISVVSPFTLVPHTNRPLLRSPVTLKLAACLSWPRLNSASFSGTSFEQPDLVLCGSPVMTEIALAWGAKRTVYRLADDSSLFEVLAPAARQAETNAIPQFDAVIVTSDALLIRAQQLKARQTILVSNGVDRSFFERPAPMPDAMAAIPSPRILYAGAIESWFDWPLVIDAAHRRPGYHFVILGRLAAPPPATLPANVHLIAQQPYATMPAFMQAASVGIVPFASQQRKEAVRAINPLKLYEYLAAGRPVVSSIRPPDLQCEGLFIYTSHEEFLANLDTAVGLANFKIGAPESVDWRTIVGRMLESLQLTRDA
jgi:glycosyltransferase involved in cell wall biosynthesis